MALSTKIKTIVNAALKPVNLKVDSLTLDRAEAQRLEEYERAIGFDSPPYALSPGMAAFDAAVLAADYAQHREAIERLKDPARNDTKYAPGNRFFESPDVEVLYLLIRRLRPRIVVEVGCGNSTRITRQATLDGGLATRIIAIDPQPRADIAHLVDHFEQNRVEALFDSDPFAALGRDDVLFIDSSHELRAGNDLAHLFCHVIPALAPGVVIHIHDIFLPYEYPRKFFFEYPSWGEQYVLHALLSGGAFEILWPGHYLQRARPDATAALPFLGQGLAQSFWIRKAR